VATGCFILQTWGLGRALKVPLNIDAVWSKPVELSEADSGAGYVCPELTLFPEEPGVYVFGRRFGDSVTPIYIGKALNLRQRMGQQFDSVKLMSRLKEAANGSRFLIYCVPKLKRGQKTRKVIKVMEDALIAHALAEGYELRQKQGTLRPNHAISFSGNRASEAIAGRFIRLRA
jgi:hypothetical protein